MFAYCDKSSTRSDLLVKHMRLQRNVSLALTAASSRGSESLWGQVEHALAFKIMPRSPFEVSVPGGDYFENDNHSTM